MLLHIIRKLKSKHPTPSGFHLQCTQNPAQAPAGEATPYHLSVDLRLRYIIFRSLTTEVFPGILTRVLTGILTRVLTGILTRVLAGSRTRVLAGILTRVLAGVLAAG